MKYKSHKDIIKAWPKPSIKNFSEAIGVVFNTAAGMYRRGHISWKYWQKVEDAAVKEKIDGVTVKILHDLSADGSNGHSEAA
jgi:hypothetical protein